MNSTLIPTKELTTNNRGMIVFQSEEEIKLSEKELLELLGDRGIGKYDKEVIYQYDYLVNMGMGVIITDYHRGDILPSRRFTNLLKRLNKVLN